MKPTVQNELKRLSETRSGFYRVAFINQDKVLSTYTGASVADLLSGKAFAATLRFDHTYILGSAILFFLAGKEATLCPRGNYL